MGLFKTDKNLAALLDELKSENAELTERVSAAEACVEEKVRALTDLQTLHAQAVAAIDAKETAIAEATATIADLQAKLANPAAAYADATEGKADAVAEGGEGSQETYWQRYHKIEDPKERTRFWRANREALENEQRHTARK